MSGRRTLDPLALLRESITNKRMIKVKNKYIYFGQTKLPLKTKTGSFILINFIIIFI